MAHLINPKLKLYTLSDRQYEAVLLASKKVDIPWNMRNSIQADRYQRAIQAWQLIAKELKIKWETIQPAKNGNKKDILAEPLY